jgi:hypothetical protein
MGENSLRVMMGFLDANGQSLKQLNMNQLPELTKRQREVLQHLRDNEHDPHEGAITCEGLACWIGDERTNWKMVKSLIDIVVVSQEISSKVLYYTINESGKRLLDGELPYRDSQGRYFPTIYHLLAANKHDA